MVLVEHTINLKIPYYENPTDSVAGTAFLNMKEPTA